MLNFHNSTVIEADFRKSRQKLKCMRSANLWGGGLRCSREFHSLPGRRFSVRNHNRCPTYRLRTDY